MRALIVVVLSTAPSWAGCSDDGESGRGGLQNDGMSMTGTSGMMSGGADEGEFEVRRNGSLVADLWFFGPLPVVPLHPGRCQYDP